MQHRLRTTPLVVVMCALSIATLSPSATFAQEQGQPAQGQPPPPATEESAPKLSAEELDSLVAPIALYPDPLLAQVLAASTYPLEVVQLQQWLEQHEDLKDKALIDAVEKQDWDPSVQGLAGLPDVVKVLTGDIKWTTDLGNAFLSQESDVMSAVQRMRAKAKKNGTLKSDDKMKVETKTVEKETVVVIEPANPQVVYVPTYNPTVVYGPAPVAYPYPPAGAYVAGAMLSFGVGVAVGAAFHGGWGYNCGWGGAHGNTININASNNFVRSTNARTGGRVAAQGQWRHDPSHRGGAPYRDRATASRYGGTTAREARAAGANRADIDRRAGADRGAAGDRGDVKARTDRERDDRERDHRQRANADRERDDRQRNDRERADRQRANADRERDSRDRAAADRSAAAANRGDARSGNALGGGPRRFLQRQGGSQR